ncbi:MAG: Ig-like domain-containing protein [Polyangiaceae bacterium]
MSRRVPRLRRWSAVPFVLLAAAPFVASCGSVGVEEACRVTATSPAFGESGAGTHTSVVIQYSHPIDFDTVAGHVTFTRLGGEPVDFTVQPVGDSGVAVQPSRELRFWEEYAVSITGDVTTAQGEDACETAEVAFTTLEPEEAPQALRPTAVYRSALAGTHHLLTVAPTARSLQVVDIANPALPSVAAEVLLDASPVSVRVHGDRAYLASGVWGIPILDVSNPASPAVLGVAGSPGQANEVAPFDSGGRSYIAVADGTMGLRIIDVTEPAGAKDIWWGAPLQGALSVAVQGNLLASVTVTGAVQLHDITSPSLPVLLSTFPPVPLPETFDAVIPANDVVFAGDHLVLSQLHAGLQSFDITDPTAPVWKSHVLGPQGVCPSNCADVVLDLHIEGDTLFAASAMSGALRATIAPDGTLTPGAFLAAPGRESSVTVAAGHLFIGGEAGLTVLDAAAAEGDAPLYTEAAGWGLAQSLAVHKGQLHVGSASRGLETYSLSDPLSPAPESLEICPGVERDFGLLEVRPIGDLLSVGDGRAGISIFDTQDPVAPALAANYQTTDTAGQIIPSADPGFVYACVSNRGVWVFDVSDPKAPVPVDKHEELNELSGGCTDLELIGDHLYYSGGKGLAVLDASTPSSLSLLSTFALPANDIVGSLAYSADFPGYLFATTFVRDWEGTYDTSQRLLVLDIGTPDAPEVAYRSEDLGGARSVEVHGDKLFIAGGEAGVLVFNASTPAAPSFEGQIPTRGSARRLAFSGETLYVAEHAGGIGAIALDTAGP